jgi:hypothetical protein
MDFQNRKIIGMVLIFLFPVLKIHTLSENHPLPNQLPFLSKASDYTMTFGK